MDPAGAKLDATLEAMVVKAAPALEQLRRAAKLPRAAWDVSADSGFDTPLPHLFMARRLAGYAVLDARLKFRGGQAAQGVVDLLAALRLARHLSAEPYFLALSEDLAIEGSALRAAAGSFKQMDADALKQLQSGLAALPPGGRMVAVMAECRRRVAAFAADLQNDPAGDVQTLAIKHFGKQTATALAGKTKDENAAAVKALLTLADRAAEAMKIPDNQIEQFERRHAALSEDWGKFIKAIPAYGGPLCICVDATDRYLEGRVRVLVPMFRAAIAYRLEGPQAAAKVPDPYAAAYGPFGIQVRDGLLEVRSALKVGTTVIQQSFTLPESK
jgi:hypothetical protein